MEEMPTVRFDNKFPRSVLDQNVWGFENLGIEAKGDRILILEDEFKSGYECPNKLCKDGKVLCEKCEGRGEVKDKQCGFCDGSGKENCPTCKGKGVISGGLVIPQEAERRPSTGKVVSVGPKVTEYSVGDHVLYSNFAGTVVNLKQKPILRFLREHECMGKLYGVVGNVQTYF